GTVNNNHIGKDGTKIYPCILFYKDRIAFNTISVGTVRFRFDFYKHGTNTKINPKGHIKMGDRDGGHGYRVDDGWGVQAMYIRNGYNHLIVSSDTASNGGQYREVRGREGEATTNSDIWGWCTVHFNGSFTMNWLAQDTWYTTTGPQNAFYVSTSQSVGTYEPNPGPEKRVGNANQAYTAMTKHDSTGAALSTSCGSNFDYVIAQRLLPGNYSEFSVSDTLDKCLTYKKATVSTAAGRDVTSKFTITKS